MGKFGCGKLILLYILFIMDMDYDGEFYIDGEKMFNLSRMDLVCIWNEKIGFVFQFYYLLFEFIVLKNVMFFVLKFGKVSESMIKVKVLEKLDMLGVVE